MDTPDPDFGDMEYNGMDAWDCRVEFEFPHAQTRTFEVHVWEYDADGPTDVQRLRFRELKKRYNSLWPAIASRISAVHDRVTTSEEVAAAMPAWVAVHLGEHSEDSVEFVVDLDLPDEGSRGYFVPLTGWEVGEVVVAD